MVDLTSQRVLPRPSTLFEAESKVAIRRSFHDGLCALQLEARIETFRKRRIPATRKALSEFLQTQFLSARI
jgi:hypothetical protein